MAFELRTPTLVEFYHVNVRREFHGEENVRAADIGICLKGENLILDLLKPGLREHHFCNTSTAPGQQPLALLALPNIRHPELPTKYSYSKGERWHGYHFTHDAGPGARGLDFDDCALADISYEFFEGGSTEIKATIQYNGEKLTDDSVYGRCAGLATLGEGRVQILAPGKLLPITDKHWRSGEGDTPPGGPAGPDVPFEEDRAADTERDVLHTLPADTPEAALARGVPAVAPEKPARGGRSAKQQAA